MANRRIANSFLNIGAHGNTSSEAEAHPASNAVDRSSPQKQWRSTVTTDSRLVLDLGTAQTDITVYMDYVNFTSFRYQESADASAWSDIGSGRTVEKDPMHGVYRRTDDIAMSGKRYLGIFIPSQTPVDGADYFRIGTVAAPSSVTELDAETDVTYPYEVSLPDTHIVQNDFPTGSPERAKLGMLQPMLFNFNLATSVNQNISGARVVEIADLLRDSTRTLYIDFNLGNSWQAYLVIKAGELRASLNTPNTGTGEFGTMVFQVIT